MTSRSTSSLTRGRIILICVLFSIALVSFGLAAWLLREWIYAPSLQHMQPPEIASGLASSGTYEFSEVTGAPRGRRDERSIVRLFYTRDGRSLHAEEILVAMQDQTPDLVLADVAKSLLAGPRSENLSPLFPDGTSLRAAYIRGRTAYVDLSDAIRTPRGGPHAEWLCVQSVTLSITETLPAVQQVRVLVEGKPVEVLWEHVDLGSPLFPDRSIVGQ